MGIGLVYKGFVPTAMEIEASREAQRRWEDEIGLRRRTLDENQRRWEVENERAQQEFGERLKGLIYNNELTENTLAKINKINALNNKYSTMMEQVRSGDFSPAIQLMQEYNSNFGPFNDNAKVDVLDVGGGERRIVFSDKNTGRIVKSMPLSMDSINDLMGQAYLQELRFIDPEINMGLVERTWAQKDKEKEFRIADDGAGHFYKVYNNGAVEGPFGRPTPVRATGERAPSLDMLLYGLAVEECKNSPNPAGCVLDRLRPRGSEATMSPLDRLKLYEEAAAIARRENKDFDKLSPMMQQNLVEQVMARFAPRTYGYTRSPYDDIVSGQAEFLRNPQLTNQTKQADNIQDLRRQMEIVEYQLRQARDDYNKARGTSKEKSAAAALDAWERQMRSLSSRLQELQMSTPTGLSPKEQEQLQTARERLREQEKKLSQGRTTQQAVDYWRNIVRQLEEKGRQGVKTAPLPERVRPTATPLPKTPLPQTTSEQPSMPKAESKPKATGVTAPPKPAAIGLNAAQKEEIRRKYQNALENLLKSQDKLEAVRGTPAEKMWQDDVNRWEQIVKSYEKQLKD